MQNFWREKVFNNSHLGPQIKLACANEEEVAIREIVFHDSLPCI
jgi:hypothetical protein